MLSISIVLYRPDVAQLQPLLDQLLLVRALRRIYLIDNSPAPLPEQEALRAMSPKISYMYQQGKNLGYGAGHNIAIRKSIYNHTEVHLVMNSDIEVQPQDIYYLYQKVMSNPQIGIVSPHVVYPDGQTQYLCKLLPTPFDLLIRRFLPSSWFRSHRDRFEMRASGYDREMNVPYLSGSFMMLRTEAVLRARLFDERYFMYPEDMDLTRTIHRDYLTLYCPDVTIVHHHARESYRSWRMLWIHIVNICRYFNKWGWFVDRERTRFNQMALAQLEDNNKNI